MKKYIVLIFTFLPLALCSAQQKNMSEIDSAFINAQKGVYWALSNIPTNKYKLSHDLISGNSLIAEVKLDVEVNGVRLYSTGHYNTTEVSIKIYKSIEALRRVGYLKNKKLKSPKED